MNRGKSGSKISVLEVNGNNPSSSSCKIENRYKQKKSRHKIAEQTKESLAELHGNYFQVHGQRLYPAMSEPAVCGYPVSVAYPYEHVPVYPMYQPPPCLHNHSCKESISSKRHRLRNTGKDKVENSKDECQAVDEYTSLPPVNHHDIESDHQRRFSDPGLATNSGSDEEDSLSNDESSQSWLDDSSQVASQIESLVQENKRISKELKETQAELQELKLEFTSLSNMRSSCEPGFVADIVREIREATKLKEETLMAKFHACSESLRNNETPSSLSVDLKKDCGKLCEKTKLQLANATLEKEELSRRLTRLEEQIKFILSHNSKQDSSKDKLLESEKENLHLQQKLKTAIEAKDIAESNSNKYERLFNSITKRLPNGLSLEDRGASASLETTESLSSDLSSGSLHSPQVTMSGPVTDL